MIRASLGAERRALEGDPTKLSTFANGNRSRHCAKYTAYLKNASEPGAKLPFAPRHRGPYGQVNECDWVRTCFSGKIRYDIPLRNEFAVCWTGGVPLRAGDLRENRTTQQRLRSDVAGMDLIHLQPCLTVPGGGVRDADFARAAST